ncbi:protein translocase subunit SecD [bacterium]|nr:protein translocase subunit SecD [bacterium]
MSEEKNIIEKIIKPDTARGRVWQVFVLIIFLTIGGLLINGGNYYNKGTDWLSQKTNDVVQLPKIGEANFSLGLDLQGGTHLVYEADVSQVPAGKEDSAVEGVRDVIERRVNVFGVSEPEIRKVRTSEGGYRIVADLAGIKDVNKAIEMIGKTPLLEFKEEGEMRAELSSQEKEDLDKYNQEAEKTAEEVLGKVLSGGDFSVLEEEYDQKTDGGEEWIDDAMITDYLKNLEKGSVYGDLIKTNESYLIMKLLDKRTKINEFTNDPYEEVEASHLLICHNESEGCESDLSKEDARAKIQEIKNKATINNFDDLVREYSDEPGAGQTGGDLSWFSREDMVKPFSDTVFDNQEVGTISYIVETKFGYHLIYKKNEREIIEYKISDIVINKKLEADYVDPQMEWKNTELTGKYLESSQISWGRTGSAQVGLQFDNEGAGLFGEITERNIGKRVAIFLDGELVSAPTVNEKITGGQAVITGSFSIQEAKEMTERLNQGALPVPIKLVSQKTVGPSLGLSSVKSSLKAGIIGLILIVLFMIITYRYLGALAVISLSIYGVLVLAVFKILSITLTLAGLAGFILSIGMAVDANVLIFERLKEEIKKGKEMSSAINDSFKRAWPSIRDGNFSTLITCFILVEFTTTLIRGFAITLAIGILVSLFSAMVITRNLMLLFPKKWINKKIIGIK